MISDPTPTPMQLTDKQKAEVCGILSVGCDRETAADYIGCLPADLRNAMRENPSFAMEVRRAEAGVELSHMRIVQEIANKKKDWRTSVWWLERRSPERYGRRSAGAVTARQLKAFTAILAGALQEDIQSDDDRKRVSARLQSLIEDVDNMLRNDSLGAPSLSDDTDLSNSGLSESGDDSFANMWNDSIDDLG
jgi:hypothetical protein